MFTADLRAGITAFEIDTGGNTFAGSDSPAPQTQTDTPAAPELQPMRFATPVQGADYGSFTSTVVQRALRTRATNLRRTLIERRGFFTRRAQLDIAGVIWKLLSTANQFLGALLEARKPTNPEKAKEPTKQDPISEPNAPMNAAPPEQQAPMTASLPRSTVQTMMRPPPSAATTPLVYPVQQRRWAAMFCVAAISILSCASTNFARRSRKRS